MTTLAVMAHTQNETEQPAQSSLFKDIALVLPEQVRNRIIQVREEQDRLQWVIGDLFNQIYAYIAANDLDATRADCANFLLYNLGLEDSRSYSSVMIDAATAAFYPVEARQRYSVLPFSHFRFAAGFGPQAVDVLDCAIRFMDHYGRPPSVKWLKSQYAAVVAEAEAGANEPGSSMSPMARAALTAVFYHPEVAHVEMQPPIGGHAEKIRFHCDALLSEVTALPGAQARIIAQIVVLLQQVLESL